MADASRRGAGWGQEVLLRSLTEHVMLRVLDDSALLTDVLLSLRRPHREVWLSRYRGPAYEPIGTPAAPLPTAKDLLETYGACRRMVREIADMYHRYTGLARAARGGGLRGSLRATREAAALIEGIRSALIRFYGAGCAPPRPRRALDSLAEAVRAGRLDPLSDDAVGRVSALVRAAEGGFREAVEGFLEAQGLLGLIREVRSPGEAR